MPIEKTPKNPVPTDYVPRGWRALYHVKDKDTWESVAQEWRVDVDRLIRFNFGFLDNVPYDPAEVNWYLRRNVGCRLLTRDGENWRFSSNADPGWLFIPAVTVQFDWLRCVTSVVHFSSQMVSAPDGVLIPLPHGMVMPGAWVSVAGDHGHGYKVHISNPSGISSDLKGLLKSGGVGIGSAAGKRMTKRVTAKALVRLVGGFIGSRIGGGVVGIFVPNSLGGTHEVDQLLPNGVAVRYIFIE